MSLCLWVDFSSASKDDSYYRIWGSHVAGFEEFYLRGYEVVIVHDCFLLDIFFDPEDGDNIFLWNVGWASNRPRGVISQKKELFVTASNLLLLFHGLFKRFVGSRERVFVTDGKERVSEEPIVAYCMISWRAIEELMATNKTLVWINGVREENRTQAFDAEGQCRRMLQQK
jgi:hypothetical protein